GLFMVTGMRRTKWMLVAAVAIGGAPIASAQPADEGVAAHATLAVDLEPERAPEPELDVPVYGEEIPLYDPGGRAMTPFYRALRPAGAGEGQARILFSGACQYADYSLKEIVQVSS